MKTRQLFMVVVAGLMLAGLTVTAVAEVPKMKMTTEVPDGVATPDKLHP